MRNPPKKNPNTTLAGSGLPRTTDTAPPSKVPVMPEQLRKLSKSAGCSVGWLVRRAVRFWLESADAKSLKGGR